MSTVKLPDKKIATPIATPNEVRLDMLCRLIAKTLDAVEQELLGIKMYHSLHVAMLSTAMARRVGMSDDEVMPIAVSALFHDSALSEWNKAERWGATADSAKFLKLHCQLGQRNLACLPLDGKADGYVLYHHERIDGSGPFHKTEGEFPLAAEFIALADEMDMKYNLGELSPNDIGIVRADTFERYSRSAKDAFLAVFDEGMLDALSDDKIEVSIKGVIPPWTINLSDPSIIRIAEMIAHIIDYKSEFTRIHTMQIANRAYLMAEYYGYDKDAKCHLYLAASLHDIGKAATPIEILEKPGGLTSEEFRIITKHVWYTWDWMHRVEGFEQICHWASAHHEKLDGSGYPFGLKADELDFNARLMACIDISQAVCEERPYHDARNHEDTMVIMREMADAGKIDSGIVRDMDIAMAPYSLKLVPPPPVLERFGEDGYYYER
jgi:HD-GYP domain-containing protein (c-di-GMP phosphodiesterase class II)